MHTLHGPFYNGGNYRIDVVDGGLDRNARRAEQISMSPEFQALGETDMDDWLQQVNEPCSLMEADGYRFEYKITRPAADAETRVAISTISSGMSNVWGAGNLFEQGLRVLPDWKAGNKPEVQELYVSSPGNGLSSPFTSAEMSYFQKTGRLTYERDGKTYPVPLVAALGRALQRQDIDVAYIDADSFGAIVGTALGVAIGGNRIKQIFQNGRPQLESLSLARLAVGMAIEAKVTNGRNEKRSPDAWAITEARKAQARRLAPRVFSEGATPTVSGRDLRVLADGLRKGPRHRDPLLKDMVALAHANPAIQIGMVNGEFDPLLKGEYPYGRAFQIARQLSGIDEVQVRLIDIPESHGWHSFFPGLRDAVRRAAFARQ